MSYFLFFLVGLGVQELVIILVILLVLFGGSRLPSLAKGLRECRNFKQESPKTRRTSRSEKRRREPSNRSRLFATFLPRLPAAPHGPAASRWLANASTTRGAHVQL